MRETRTRETARRESPGGSSPEAPGGRPDTRDGATRHRPRTGAGRQALTTLARSMGDDPNVEVRSGRVGTAPWCVINADARTALRGLRRASVDCVVTSPPYYWQRDYEVEGQLGHEDTAEAYVEALRSVFREVRRVLRPAGLLFLVLGDTYYSGKGRPHGEDEKQPWRGVARRRYRAVDRPGFGLPRKTLIGVPWRVALGLQQDGWRIRSAVTWRKPKALAEPSVKDRPWSTTEVVFILARGPTYYFNRKALRGEEDVWTLSARSPGKAYRHAAPFPEALVERCLACGCRPGGLVLDPFAGSGTTLRVALQRRSPALGIELNPEYCEMAVRRLSAPRKQRAGAGR